MQNEQHTDKEPLFFFTGGGTMGHIQPALAIWSALKARRAEARCIYVGAGHSLEEEIAEREGLPFIAVPASPFKRRLSLALFKAFLDYQRGRRLCLKILREKRPAAIVATGGYVSAPLLAAARRYKVPYLIHEQNAMPGQANRLAARKAACVCLGYEAAKPYFKQAERCVWTGNPISDRYRQRSREDARRALGIDADDFLILCTGGSLGARKLNQVMLAWLAQQPQAVSGRWLKIVLVSGKRLADEVKQDIKARGLEQDTRLMQHDFLYNLDVYQAAADLIICRSGALTCAELACLGRVALYVPYPYATGDHQSLNAKAAVDVGGALMIADQNFSPEAIQQAVALCLDEEKKTQMERRHQRIAQLDAADHIVDELLALLGSDT